jgi:hypothetical protein
MWVFPYRHLTHLSFPPGWDDSAVTVAVLRLCDRFSG